MDGFIDFLVSHKKILRQNTPYLHVSTLQQYMQEFQESQQTTDPSKKEPSQTKTNGLNRSYSRL